MSCCGFYRIRWVGGWASYLFAGVEVGKGSYWRRQG